jgi:hypothetical protein
MSVAEIQKEVASLPEKERAELAAFILDTLEDECPQVSDADALRRRDELLNGQVTGMTRAEFAIKCGPPGNG